MIFSKRLTHLLAASLSLLLYIGLSSCTVQDGSTQHGIDRQQKISSLKMLMISGRSDYDFSPLQLINNDKIISMLNHFLTMRK